MSNVQHTQCEFVDTFGKHKVPPYEPYNINREAIDFITPELHQHCDQHGDYTLYIDATDYARAQGVQWYSDAAGVLEFHDNSDFLSINSREQAEEVARYIAYEANKEIQQNYIDNPYNDVSPADLIASQYEERYGEEAPEFDIFVEGTVEIVEVEDLMDWWEEHQDDED